MSTTIVKPGTGSYDWSKATGEDLKAALPLLYPGLPLDPTTINKAGLIGLVSAKARGLSLAELQAEHEAKQKETLLSLGADVLALTFPEGIQDVLNRLGTTVNVSEKYTSADQIKAYQLVARRIKTAKCTVAEAQAMPIKEVQRKGTVKFDVTAFFLDDADAAPLDVRNFVKALLTIDPATRFGLSPGKRPCVRYQCPTIMPGRTSFVMISEEYAIQPATE
jgi:hypothetical protein